LNVYLLAMLLIKKTFASLCPVTETFYSYSNFLLSYLLSAIKLNVTRTLYYTLDI